MTEALKVVGQLDPSAATQTTLYTVPGSTQFSGKLTVCNRSTVPTSWRMRVNIAGVGDDNKQYRFFDQPIGSNETVEVFGIALAATDVMKVYATLATLAFTLEGVERT